MILKDSCKQDRLESRGFVKFPLFTPEDLMEIKEFYHGIENEHNVDRKRSFHTTLNTSDHKLVGRVHDFLLPYFTKRLTPQIDPCNFTLAGFLAKDSGKNSAVTIHQDWNYVDESRYSSYSLWVGLEDTNVWNGCMQFIPGSHRFYPSLRISPDIPDYFDGFKDKAADYLVDVPSKAGECVMFDQGIIHASRRNRSGRQRVACILGAYPENADLLHHFRPPGNSLDEIEQHTISVSSMIGMKKDQRPPESILLGHISYAPLKIGRRDFVRKCSGHVTAVELCRTALINSVFGKSI